MWTYFLFGLTVVAMIGAVCIVLTVSDAIDRKLKAKEEQKRKAEEQRVLAMLAKDQAVDRKGRVWEQQSKSDDVILPDRPDIDMVEWDSTWQSLYEKRWDISKDYDFLDKFGIPVQTDGYEDCATKLDAYKDKYPQYTFGLFREYDEWEIVVRTGTGRPLSDATRRKLAVEFLPKR